MQMSHICMLSMVIRVSALEYMHGERGQQMTDWDQ